MLQLIMYVKGSAMYAEKVSTNLAGTSLEIFDLFVFMEERYDNNNNNNNDNTHIPSTQHITVGKNSFL